MCSFKIRKKITIDEFSFLIRSVLENNGDVYIYQDESDDSSKDPYINFDFNIKECISTNFGVQFNLQEGHILLNFKFSPIVTHEVDFSYDDEKGTSEYQVHFSSISIIFNISPSKFKYLVDSLEENMKLEIEKNLLFNAECEEANKDMPSGLWKHR